MNLIKSERVVYKSAVLTVIELELTDEARKGLTITGELPAPIRGAADTQGRKDRRWWVGGWRRYFRERGR